MTEIKNPVLKPDLDSFSPDIKPQGESDAAKARSPFYKIPGLALAYVAAPADALAQTRTKGKINPYSPNTLTVSDIVITTTGDNAIQALGVGESKVLSAGIQAFTAANSRGQAQPQLRVVLDTADYASKCGVEITPRKMDTPEAQAAENRRADIAANNFLKKTRKNLRNIRKNASFSWTEKVNGRIEAYNEISFISDFRITRKSITMDFGLAAAEYLVKNPLRQEPDALYLIDERREEAYAIGRYLNQHYSIDANVTRGTEGILSIPSILSVTAIPSIQEVQNGKSKRTWQDQIKDRLERDLDELTRVGFLKTWTYSYAKKQLLTDAEAAEINTYEEFAALYLCYEIANYPDHKDRVKAIEVKREEKKRKYRRRGTGRRHKAEGGK